MVDAGTIYVHAAAAVGPYGASATARRRPLTADPDTDLGDLVRQALGQRLRQASHFAELAVLGARLCLSQTNPARDMAVYVGTALGEMRRTEQLFAQVFPPGAGLAAPFDFINANANMAAFYVARMAGVSARNLTVTQGVFSFELALQLACSDLCVGAVSAALVGGVDENCFPRSQYLRRWPLRDTDIMGEGSAWLYLSPAASGALAQLKWVRRLAPVADTATWVGRVTAELTTLSTPTVLAGVGVSAADRAALAAALPRARLLSYGEYCGAYPTAAGFGIADYLQDASAGDWAHVNRDADNVTVLVAGQVPTRAGSERRA